MAKRAVKAADNWKRKKWYSIFASHHFKNAPVGETLALEKEELLGKKVTQNIMALTGDVRKKDVLVTFKVNKVDDGKAETELVGYEVVQSTIKRLVRRGRDRLDDSLLLKSIDGFAVKVKLFVVTATNTKSSTRKAVRYGMRKALLDYLSQNTFDAFASDVLAGKVQKHLVENMKKYYPVRTCEVRRFHIVPQTEGRAHRFSAVDIKIREHVTREPRVRQPKAQEDDLLAGATEQLNEVLEQ